MQHPNHLSKQTEKETHRRPPRSPPFPSSPRRASGTSPRPSSRTRPPPRGRGRRAVLRPVPPPAPAPPPSEPSSESYDERPWRRSEGTARLGLGLAAGLAGPVVVHFGFSSFRDCVFHRAGAAGGVWWQTVANNVWPCLTCPAEVRARANFVIVEPDAFRRSSRTHSDSAASSQQQAVSPPR
ncbi:hypothetical protein THAOC_26264 [Thalassiosira oceanica]|uniref:Uncharacterized protein n=1 Tax=Thalassiosira oceanica TaxID=159749 RepID=K0RZH6_THAOC|nr:hypothetical protein THAOC_26264 [Thalassiosira oceanica]|eukprot:EJK54171.1 hypothetical protein THAOC_26264 [Thalassiosira oceanica]